MRSGARQTAGCASGQHGARPVALAAAGRGRGGVRRGEDAVVEAVLLEVGSLVGGVPL